MQIALAQINPTVADITGNTGKIISFIDRARAAKADLVVFPEMAILGYPPMDLLENHALIDRNLEALEEIARSSAGIPVICGYVDRDPDNLPLLYNSAAFLDEGRIICRQHKRLLPTYDVFDEHRYFSPGRDYTIIEIGGRRVGITICEDIWNVHVLAEKGLMESRRYPSDPVGIFASRGADLIINISASPFVKGKFAAKREMIREIAKAHRLPIVYVNQVGGNDSLIFDGRSFAVDARGGFLGQAAGFDEDLVLIDPQGTPRPLPPDDEIDDIYRALVLGLRDYVRKCGFHRVVLGLSGGIDSALTAALAVAALGPENVMGITMPSVFSSQGSVDDSVALARNLGIRIETVPIRGLHEEYLKELAPLFAGMAADTTEENIQARIRGNILMAVSNKTGALLLTTGNKSELAMGYCTLYGDMSGGLAVISDLPKTLVYRLSRYINREREIIPAASIEKPPSAELRPDQKDEDSLPPYEVLDRILELYIEDKQSAEEITAAGFDPELVRSVLRTVNINEYKRRQAATGLKVTSKAFGTGRRVPIAQRFRP